MSADFGYLANDIEMTNKSVAEWLHVDVMDGVFVPNISFGFPILKVAKEYSTKLLDVHLMIVEPEKYIERFVKAGAEVITVHLETLKEPKKTLRNIHKMGVLAGISINPDIPVSALTDVVEEADLVLLMSVFAGYGGQTFIEESYTRLQELKALVEEKNPNCIIEIDGGVNSTNAQRLFDLGADVLVAGSAVFGNENPEKAILELLGGQK